MHLEFTAIIVLFSISCILVVGSEEHLVPKHGIESKHDRRKRDLSTADAELILKTLLSKLKHIEVPELLPEKIGQLTHGSRIMDKSQFSSRKEEGMKYIGKGHPLEHEYMEGKYVPHEIADYESEKDISLTESGMIALLKKLKDLPPSKDVGDIYKKESHRGNPEGKFPPQKAHLSEEFDLEKTSDKTLDYKMYPDKVTDKDISLAESLRHMKIAGDVESYPEIKMEAVLEMHKKKMADEKLHLDDPHSLPKMNSDESFMKKVDEAGKYLMMDETYPLKKEDSVEEYLKKAVAEEKGIFYDPKLTHSNKDHGLEKIAEEKALEEWKANHKDIFAATETHLSDEKIKLDGAHPMEKDISHGINDELIKKLKASLGVEKGLVSEHDELLRLAKELHKEEIAVEGSTAYEKAKEQAHKDAHIHLTDEEMKKHIDEALRIGSKDLHGTEMFFEKGLNGEKAHGLDTKLKVGVGKPLHGMFDEEALKSKEIHGFGEDLDKEKAFYDGKGIFGGEIKPSKAHEIPFTPKEDKVFKVHNDEFLKKDVAFKVHDDELLSTDKAFKSQQDEFLKKDKPLKADSDHHIRHILKDEESHILHDTAVNKQHAGGTVGAEKGHKPFHKLKAKFFELLARVLRTRKCHLVSMRPSELLGIVNCISKSKNPALCEKFAMCEKKMPYRVIAALEKCQLEIIPEEQKKCTSYSPLFPSSETPLKIFQCIALNVGELVHDEKKHMIDFEECAKVIKSENCGRFKWFRGPH